MEGLEFYRCEKCGNIMALVSKGDGEPACCGQSMKRLEANTADASKEKHVPAITRVDGIIKVSIGSVPHPMLQEHHIEWIALSAGSRLEFAFLKPGMEPKAEFAGVDGGTVYEYCNLHGLWKADF